MHHVVALIAERQGGTCTNRRLSQLLSVMCLCPRLDAKLQSSQGSHWKQPLYSYGVEFTVNVVTDALAHAGLESSNLIVGVDFTKSNEWTGKRSFNRRSLHHIGNDMNPYEEAISIIGRTLASFDEDNLIPCFGFGDASTHDQEVFSFYPGDRFCDGFEDVLKRYRELAPQLRLAGPTSFAPIIEMAITIVEQSGGQYHVLLIIADGQVTRSVDTDRGQLSPQERRTVEAIVKASEYPLSIVLVGVGDGPWDMMKEFDDNIPARAFDNFQASFIWFRWKSLDVLRLVGCTTGQMRWGRVELTTEPFLYPSFRFYKE
ncbi:putative von Willebrand factor, type A, copine, von Willebrand factor A-like domain superfamily [Helianthus annuus]|nr:putative von Willebrand factor, type A, copine, von Willebrand factor A-like domain superfamily [Helianthus annuus]